MNKYFPSSFAGFIVFFGWTYFVTKSHTKLSTFYFYVLFGGTFSVLVVGEIVKEEMHGAVS